MAVEESKEGTLKEESSSHEEPAGDQADAAGDQQSEQSQMSQVEGGDQQ
jgi:hypothetical protein